MKGHKYVYHITPRYNIESIRNNGLQPTICKKFGAMSPELLGNKKPTLFFIPILNGYGMKGFLQEWWHDSNDITILRVNRNDILNLYGSQEHYYRKQELWCFNSVKPKFIKLNKNGLSKPYVWVNL